MVKQTIQIFARVKPAKKNTSVYSVDNEDPGCGRLEFVVPRDLAGGFINNKRDSYKFRFQRVFDQGAKQEEVFETIAKPVADSVLAGYNGTIFAYGQTGSGKTFTITGGAERYSDRGIIPRTLSYLYQHLSQNGSMVYTTHISYLEIYNEAGYDLLDPQHEASRMEDLPKVTIMEDPDQNIHLKNLSLQPSANEEEALNLLFLGDTNRMIAETPMNEASTRSHCIFTIHLCGREPGSATLRRSKLHLVDLAGSERVGKTGVGGLILTEAKYINLSLHYLEQVIIALSEKNRSHIPYRNSMMTSVLRDSLGGNCMTTMIATVAVDKRNVDESISTCRFAQRVAQIKNEALLNEELDPALLIVRLRREIQALREELAMVTGEQRTDDLTQEEIHRLEEQVNVFLEDPDSEVTLDLGPDMRKIHHCFSLLKAKVLERPSALTRDGDGSSPPGPGVSDGGDCAPADVVEKLRGMLTQRDNEISILVSMLKKEKRRVQEANAQLASVSRGDLTSRSSLRSPAAMSEEDRRGNGIEESTDNAPRLAMSRKRGPELSMGCQEALEIFRRDHEDRLTIEDNKAVLKQRFAEAKALGVRVNQARGKVNELKRQLELRRMQVAAQGVAGVTAEAGWPDLVEEKLREQIEEEKKNYKNAFTRLKGLKTEIEHLQLLLERAKLKVQRDFQAWWTQETARLQQKPPPETAAISGSPPPCGRPSPRDPGWMRSAREHAGRGEMEPGPPTVSDQRDLVPRLLVPPYTDRGSSSSSELSALSSSGLPSAAPLTGDQQTDMDILAFIRARQNLLSRNGAAKGSQ